MAISIGTLNTRITTGTGVISKGSQLTYAEGDANVIAIAGGFALAAPIASPVLTGTPIAPTPGVSDNTTSIATTSFVYSSTDISFINVVGRSTFILSAVQYSAPAIIFTDVIATNITAYIPNSITKRWDIYNNTTGNFTISIKTVSGSTIIAIPQGGSKVIYSDGTELFDMFPTQTLSNNTTAIATTAFVQNVRDTLTPRTGVNGSTIVPSGSTAQRDNIPLPGYLRYNSDIAQFEGYSGTVWGKIGGGATGGSGDAAFYENDSVISQNYTIGAGSYIAGISISIASPAVIGLEAHGMSIGIKVTFSTTGTLPTGMFAATPYYIISTGYTVDQFQISSTDGGPAIVTSGTQSGIHSIAKIKNAITAGPIKINTGITVTIPTGSTWSII